MISTSLETMRLTNSQDKSSYAPAFAWKAGIKLTEIKSDLKNKTMFIDLFPKSFLKQNTKCDERQMH